MGSGGAPKEQPAPAKVYNKEDAILASQRRRQMGVVGYGSNILSDLASSYGGLKASTGA